MRFGRISVGSALFGIVTAGVAVAGGVPSAAAAAPATHRAAATAHVKVHHLCSAPKPGKRECFGLRVKGSHNTPNAASPNATPSGYGPSDLRSAYNIPAAGGVGTTVAIVDAHDDPDAESDLAVYRSTYGLPACTTANGCFKKVNQVGGASPLPTADTGWAGEIALDIDMVSAACPNCHILLVEANSATNSDLDTAVNYAAAHASIVSNSYGGSESSSDTSDASYNHPGTLILASSGDEGYVTEFPAASPTVLAVGGTALNHVASGGRAWSESVWNTSNSEGAGSGCSHYETQPSWQASNANVASVCAKRAVADVSAVADPNTGVAVYDVYGSGGWAVYGGTSVASPLVGGIFAATGQATATGAYPYAHPSNFYDVTTGKTASSCTNILCEAGTGWDGPTGIGTPNGQAMAGGTPSSDFSISDSPTTGSTTAGSGTSTTVSTATTAGSAQSVALSVSGLPAGATATFSPTSVTSGASSTLAISTTSAIGNGTYTLTITGTAASGTHTATYKLTVTGGACAKNSQKLANPGFESGSTGWTATSGVINTDGAHSRTGNGYAWLDGYGHAHTDTLSQSVTIPAGACTARLGFWLDIASSETTTTAAHDKLTITVNGTRVATFSNLQAASAYVHRSINLASYKGQTVTIQFSGVENASLATSFFIDDTAVNVT